MYISEFTVSCLEGPLFMRIKISHSDVVNYDIVNKGVSINANLHIEFTSWVGRDYIVFIRNVILFKYLKAMKFFKRK